MKFCSIYKISSLKTNKIYIGQTWNTLNKRFKDHKSPNANGCVKLWNAFNKYGRDSFHIELILVCNTQETADYWEKHFIERYDTIKNGLNIKEGGSHGKMSEESKTKVSNARKGMKFSKKTKQKISSSMLGNKNNKNNKGNSGKTLSKETRQKISATNTGMKLSEVQKKKIGKVFAGKSWKLINGKRVWNLSKIFCGSSTDQNAVSKTEEEGLSPSHGAK